MKTTKAEWGSVPKVDDIARADIHAINKATGMESGRYTVRHNRKVGDDLDVKIAGGVVQVTFQLEDRKRRLKAAWEMSEVGFGQRPTFICPICTKPTKHLYPDPGGCRDCCNIRYPQRGKRWPTPASMKTCDQIEQLLGWSLAKGCPQPKGMSEKKHLSFIARVNELAKAEHAAKTAQAQRVEAEERRQEEQSMLAYPRMNKKPRRSGGF